MKVKPETLQLQKEARRLRTTGLTIREVAEKLNLTLARTNYLLYYEAYQNRDTKKRRRPPGSYKHLSVLGSDKVVSPPNLNGTVHHIAGLLQGYALAKGIDVKLLADQVFTLIKEN